MPKLLDTPIKKRQNGPTQTVLPEEYRPLPDSLVAEPEVAAAASPWLNDYLEFSHRWSPRSCPAFHHSCAMWLLSTIAAGRVGYEWGGPGYPSLYLALVGRSGLSAKTSVIRIALDALEELGLRGLLLPDYMDCAESLLESLVDRDGDRYDRLDEAGQAEARLRTGFGGQRGWYFQPYDTELLALDRYDTVPVSFQEILRWLDAPPPELDFRFKPGQPLLIERPYLTWLVEVAPVSLRAVARPGSDWWRTGFLGRVLLAAPPEGAISTARFPDGERRFPASLIEPLRAWHERLGLPQVEVVRPDTGGPTQLRRLALPPAYRYEIRREIGEALYAYECALLELARQSLPEDLIPSYLRLPEKALRVAVLLASVEGEAEVGMAQWARGQQMAESWRMSLHRVYEQMMK